MKATAALSRRKVLRFGVAGAASVAAAALAPRLALATATNSQGSPQIAHTALSDSLHLLVGAGGNVVACAGPESVLLVDGGLEQYSAALLAQVAQATAGRKL